jgi:putative membrane protein
MIKYTVLALGALALAACGQQTTTADAPETTNIEGPVAPVQAAMTDAEFVQAVANADAFEIQTSELAATRAARQQVKDFATIMIRDHRATTQALTTLAPTINVAAPTPAIDSAMQGTLTSLQGQNGEAFDDAYLDAQVAAHENAIRTFESYIATAAAGPLKDWANNTLPNLRTHLSSVQGLENAT